MRNLYLGQPQNANAALNRVIVRCSARTADFTMSSFYAWKNKLRVWGRILPFNIVIKSLMRIWCDSTILFNRSSLTVHQQSDIINTPGQSNGRNVQFDVAVGSGRQKKSGSTEVTSGQWCSKIARSLRSAGTYAGGLMSEQMPVVFSKQRFRLRQFRSALTAWQQASLECC